MSGASPQYSPPLDLETNMTVQASGGLPPPGLTTEVNTVSSDEPKVDDSVIIIEPAATSNEVGIASALAQSATPVTTSSRATADTTSPNQQLNQPSPLISQPVRRLIFMGRGRARTNANQK